MNSVHYDWIALLAPFLSGSVGVGVTIGFSWGIIRQRITDHERRIAYVENKADAKVFEARCDKYRSDCKEGICEKIDDLKGDIISLRDLVMGKRLWKEDS